MPAEVVEWSTSAGLVVNGQTGHPVPFVVRAPRTNEFETLRTIERAAGALFAELGRDDIAGAEPASVEQLAEYAVAGRAWVVTIDGVDTPAGYAVVDVVDGVAHLEQISVDPVYGRRGLGSALVDHVCGWAAAHGYDAVTLTTFADIPLNAPFYAARGFRVLTEAETGPELTALVAREADHGLDPAERVTMRRDI